MRRHRTMLMTIPMIMMIMLPGAGCVTPVIPLPPPEPERYALTVPTPEKDEVVISGPRDDAHRGTFIFFLNLTSGKGTITLTRPDGSFETDPLPARDQDRLDLWFARGADDVASDITCALVDFSAKNLQRCR